MGIAIGSPWQQNHVSNAEASDPAKALRQLQYRRQRKMRPTGSHRLDRTGWVTMGNHSAANIIRHVAARQILGDEATPASAAA
jgi:hypothetical protein